MEVATRVEFRGMPPSGRLRAAILDQIAGLEDRFGRLTSCRIVLKAPGARHENGGLYELSIRLALPGGREVNVGRTAMLDERHADVHFAINDAFKRARRRLQDHARRMDGQVKTHADPPVGTVLRLDPAAGFGFLTSNDGREIYFNRNSVLNGGFGKLDVGTRVAFAEEMGEKGPQASTVKLLGKHALR